MFIFIFYKGIHIFWNVIHKEILYKYLFTIYFIQIYYYTQFFYFLVY